MSFDVARPRVRCRVRPATAADLPALAALFHELERHYDGAAALDEPAIRRALERQVFGARTGIEILVAESGGRLLGLASLSTVFPAARFAPALFLKDLFVTEGARSRGVGTALLRAVARLAAARGCSRVTWTAGRNDAAALAFYAGLGARVWDEAVPLRLDGEALARLAAAPDDE